MATPVDLLKDAVIREGPPKGRNQEHHEEPLPPVPPPEELPEDPEEFKESQIGTGTLKPSCKPGGGARLIFILPLRFSRNRDSTANLVAQIKLFFLLYVYI